MAKRIPVFLTLENYSIATVSPWDIPVHRLFTSMVELPGERRLIGH